MLNEDFKPTDCIGRLQTRMLMLLRVSAGMNEMCCDDWEVWRV